jgi:hypothetical protein
MNQSKAFDWGLCSDTWSARLGFPYHLRFVASLFFLLPRVLFVSSSYILCLPPPFILVPSYFHTTHIELVSEHLLFSPALTTYPLSVPFFLFTSHVLHTIRLCRLELGPPLAGSVRESLGDQTRLFVSNLRLSRKHTLSQFSPHSEYA